MRRCADQIVNKKALAEYPLLSCTACVEAFAVLWLARASARAASLPVLCYRDGRDADAASARTHLQ
jgi:hypothetical protein